MTAKVAEFMNDYLAILVSVLIGTLGYSLLFNVKKSRIIYCCIGGTLTTLIYFICAESGFSLLVQNMIPAAIATFYAELMARIVKAPATVFLIPSIIPLVPGGRLYYTMSAMVDGNKLKADVLGGQTVLIAIGLAVGVVLVSVCFYQIASRPRYNIRFERGGQSSDRQKAAENKSGIAGIGKSVQKREP